VAHQPVSVAIEAGGRAFQLYQSVLLFYDDNCVILTFLTHLIQRQIISQSKDNCVILSD